MAIPNITLTEEHTLTPDEFAWMWRRYKQCTFPYASFPKRFAQYPIEKLTEDKGKPMAIKLAYQYRRQIFAGKTVAKITVTDFIKQVRLATPKTLTFTCARCHWQGRRSELREKPQWAGMDKSETTNKLGFCPQCDGDEWVDQPTRSTTTQS